MEADSGADGLINKQNDNGIISFDLFPTNLLSIKFPLIFPNVEQKMTTGANKLTVVSHLK